MTKLTHIYIYPVKSLGGIELTSAVTQERGLKYDRRWMLVDDQGIFMNQRKYSKMALLKTSIGNEKIQVTAPDNSSIDFPLDKKNGQILDVKVWDDECKGYEVGEIYNTWFSDKLNVNCRLVYMGDQKRNANSQFVKYQEKVSYADGYQYLIVGQSSLDDLNNRLERNVPINRFRPNLVFSGGNPFEEDDWVNFQIGEVDFYGVKPCARCILTTIDQQTGIKGTEPLKTLSSFRQRGNRIYFGLNASIKKEGIIKTGDALVVFSKK